ncbi:MAG: lytic transglycosylase domain-containing protein [Amaricoccus sp.]
MLGLGWGIGPEAAAAPAPSARPARALAGHLAPRPRAAAAIGRRCTTDGTLCIRQAAYVRDVCRAIEALARDNGLDRGFFARLLWKESLFEAAAVSPSGAQGIAQFMPATAERRGLSDAFNPAEALATSARYLADLSRDYGNPGLAAAAYNGGEARLDRFLAAKGALPRETRAYVEAITGLPVETWRDAPPETLDLALAGNGPFEADCIAQAARRGASPTAAKPALKPWGAVVASNRSSDGAARQVERLRNRYAGVLRGETVSFTGGRMPGMPQRLVFAQVGRDTRSAADAFCTRIRSSGGDCLVRRNRP